jgi:hypothetical protein
MNKIFVRPGRPEEANTFAQWSLANPVNGFDPAVAAYPSSVTWCAYDDEGPLAYQTQQHPVFLESLAMRPGATKLQTASALRELTQNAITNAHIRGAGEIYYLSSDPGTDEFASNHIFEEVPFKVFRVKIADLEDPNARNT